MVNVTPEQWSEITNRLAPRYEAVECNDGLWGVRDNTTGSLMSDGTGHIVFKYESNARLMTRVVNDRA
jgi:hypothetical protein